MYWFRSASQAELPHLASMTQNPYNIARLPERFSQRKIYGFVVFLSIKCNRSTGQDRLWRVVRGRIINAVTNRVVSIKTCYDQR